MAPAAQISISFSGHFLVESAEEGTHPYCARGFQCRSCDFPAKSCACTPQVRKAVMAKFQTLGSDSSTPLTCDFFRADDGIRTRDPHLGKKSREMTDQVIFERTHHDWPICLAIADRY
jgi:hypothetical protein